MKYGGGCRVQGLFLHDQRSTLASEDCQMWSMAQKNMFKSELAVRANGKFMFINSWPSFQ